MDILTAQWMDNHLVELMEVPLVAKWGCCSVAKLVQLKEVLSVVCLEIELVVRKDSSSDNEMVVGLDYMKVELMASRQAP